MMCCMCWFRAQLIVRKILVGLQRYCPPTFSDGVKNFISRSLLLDFTVARPESENLISTFICLLADLIKMKVVIPVVKLCDVATSFRVLCAGILIGRVTPFFHLPLLNSSISMVAGCVELF